jgi:predicted transcriptional regulator
MTVPSVIISGFNLSLDQGIAEKLGVDAALVFNHIIYWLKINASKPDSEKIEDKYWMYETQQQMADFFGFYSEDQISKAVKKLVDHGLIIKKCLSKNPFDRKSWYTVYDQQLIKKSLRNPEIDGIGVPKSAGSQPPKSAGSEPPKSAECIYTTEETTEEHFKTTTTTSNAAVDQKKKFPSEMVHYKTPGGKEKSISASEIYSHFLKSNFKTETIAEAIQIVKSKNEPFGNIIKLLESICFSIEEKASNPVKYAKEKQKPSWESIPKCTEKGVGVTDEQLARIGVKRKE